MISHEIVLLDGEKEGTIVKIGGILESARKIFTKKSNSEMAFIAVADDKGILVECVVFPRTYEMYKDLLVPDTVIILEGKLDTKNEKPVILVDRISSASSFTL